ncbi:MAG: V-type ATP synthase subunit F [Clostridiales bacterium]|nr:MAG: V-type ATP synthase subunit F [Clostridiales bacterium]
MEYKIAVIGDYDSVLGFKAVGFDAVPADTAESVKAALKELAAGPYAVIYITEQAASLAMEEVAKYTDRLAPAVILLPGKSGSLGIGKTAVKKSVERAVGADIISGTIDQQ